MLRFNSPTGRITLFITIFPLITLVFYGVISNAFFVNAQNKVIQQDINMTKKYLMDMERQYLKENVESLSVLITLNSDQQKELAKKTIKRFISSTAKIANNIYHNNTNRMQQDELKKLLVTTLKGVNFGSNIEYLFLMDTQGNIFIHRDDSLVNSNILEIQDITGKYIVKDFLQILNQQQEGYAQYYWYKDPAQKNNVYPKISYIKMLDAFDWFIGAGIPTQNISLESGKVILDYIEKNDRYKDAIFYISDSSNNIVFTHNKEMQHDLIKYRIEGFYQDDHNIAYTRYLPQQDWYITVLKDLAAIQQNIAQKKSESISTINNKIETNIYLIVATWLLSLFLSLYLSRLIYNMLKRYENTISDANEKLVFQSRQAAIGELLPMIAHQWRQPINKIASILMLIRFDLSDNKVESKTLDQQCQKIEDNIEFMSQTIEDFRTFYQPEKQCKNEDLKLLIDKSIAFLEPQIRKKGISILTPEKSMSCELYGNEFMQVIINLIDNALQAVTQNEGEIIIKLDQSSEQNIRVSVEDNGKGIDETDRQKIFEPYFSTKEGSMGLGLYMSKMIIEKHLHGQISVEKLSTGTRFNLILPISSAEGDCQSQL